MSTELLETPSGLQVTRFCCGRCRASCYQLTDSIGFVIVHANEARGVVHTILEDLAGRRHRIIGESPTSNPLGASGASEGVAP